MVAELRAAAGRTDITPGGSLPLAGWATRHAPCQGVTSPLEAAAAVFRLGDQVAVVVSVDLLYGGALREMVRARLRQPLAPQQLFFAATHTHFAPATDPGLPRLGTVDADYLEAAAASIGSLIDELTDTPGEPALLSYGQGSCELAINRRLRSTDGTPARQGPNENGPCDPRLHTLSFRRRADDSPLVVLWSWACHPVACPDRLRLCADFPGEVRSSLAEAGAHDCPTLFLQGFSGDLRPRPLGTGLREGLLRPLRGSRFEAYSEPQWQAFCRTLSADVRRSLEGAGAVAVDRLTASRVELPLGELLDGAGSERTVALQRLGFGPDLSIVGIAAEPVTEHVARVERAFAGRRTIAVGCLDAPFGYWPSTRMLPDRGYEAEDFLPTFELGNCRFRDPDAALEAALAALAKRSSG